MKGATLAGMRTRIAVMALVVLVLAACASMPGSRAPYVGEFTGAFVDGVPLYRLPTIEVVGSRRSLEGS